MARYKTITVDGKEVVEHRKIWEDHHQQKIPPGYEVHHIDGDGHNNDPSNLMLLTVSEHRSLHAHLRKEGVDVVDSTNPDVAKARAATKRWCDAHPEYFRDWSKTHKESVRTASKRYRERHYDEVVAKDAKYRRDHPDERKAAVKRWEASHKSERAAYNAAYKAAHPELKETSRVRAKLWYAENREAAKDRIAKWQAEHKSLIRAQANLRNAKKRGDSPERIAELTEIVRNEKAALGVRKCGDM